MNKIDKVNIINIISNIEESLKYIRNIINEDNNKKLKNKSKNFLLYNSTVGYSSIGSNRELLNCTCNFSTGHCPKHGIIKNIMGDK